MRDAVDELGPVSRSYERQLWNYLTYAAASMVNTAGVTPRAGRPADDRPGRTRGCREHATGRHGSAHQRPTAASDGPDAAEAGSPTWPEQPRPPRRTATDPYGVRSRSQPPGGEQREQLGSGRGRRAAARHAGDGAVRAGRRKPSDWAACTARSGKPVSPSVRDQISRPIRSRSARVRRVRRPTPRRGRGIRRRPRPTAARSVVRRRAGPGTRLPAAARRQQPGPRRAGDGGGHGRPCRGGSSIHGSSSSPGRHGHVQRDVEAVLDGVGAAAPYGSPAPRRTAAGRRRRARRRPPGAAPRRRGRSGAAGPRKAARSAASPASARCSTASCGDGLLRGAPSWYSSRKTTSPRR